MGECYATQLIANWGSSSRAALGISALLPLAGSAFLIAFSRACGVLDGAGGVFRSV